jgi:hypothetical protein
MIPMGIYLFKIINYKVQKPYRVECYLNETRATFKNTVKHKFKYLKNPFFDYQ